jgi:hypothetical protein
MVVQARTVVAYLRTVEYRNPLQWNGLRGDGANAHWQTVADYCGTSSCRRAASISRSGGPIARRRLAEREIRAERLARFVEAIPIR